MKTKLLFTITIVLIVLFSTSSLNAQVTIGSNTPPRPGSILDLSQGDVTTKGLGLPRVKLKSLTITSDNNLATTIDGASTNPAWNKDKHIGMMIYNAANRESDNTNETCPGIHVWNGDKWVPLAPYPAVQERMTLASVTNRNFEYLDPNSAVGWPSDKTRSNYPIGHIGTFTDNRPNDTPMTYHYSRFYVGYRTYTATYNVERSYNCSASAAPNWVNAGSVNKNERIFDDGVWMTQNLAAIVMPDGSSITNSIANSKTAPLFGYTNYSAANRANDGVVYNYPAAINMGTGTEQTANPGTASQGGSNNLDVHIQGVCPTGWYLPSDQNFTDLENAIIRNTILFSSTANIGTLISYNATNINGTHGVAMRSMVKPGGSASTGTSKSVADGGFNAQLVGGAYDNAYYNYNNIACYWTASNAQADLAWPRSMGVDQTGTKRSQDFYESFLSVRCMKE